MNKYKVEVVYLDLDDKWDTDFLEVSSFNEFTLSEFIEYFYEARKQFDYHADVFCFTPISSGTVMYRKGPTLKKITKREYYTQKLRVAFMEE